MREYRKTVAAAVIVCLLPMIFSVIVYQDLPDRIAVHWNAAGVADGYAPKFVGAFGLPVFMAVVEFVCAVGTLHDPKKQNQSKTSRMISIWTIPVLTLIIQPATLLIALGRNINVSFIVTTMVGICLILAGNYLPKSRQNYTIGIKLPWTLADADNWNKTHRLGGVLFIAEGLILMACGFIPMSPQTKIFVIAVSLAVVLMVPAAYSFVLYLRSEKREKQEE